VAGELATVIQIHCKHIMTPAHVCLSPLYKYTETFYSAFINLKNTKKHQHKSHKQGVATCTPTVPTYGCNWF